MSSFLTRINGDLEEECRSGMLHDNMDHSRLMVYAQQAEDSRKKTYVRDVRSPRPQDHAGPSHGGHMNNFGVHGILTLRGVQHLEEADLNPRGAMDVRYNILRRTVLNVAELTVDSAERALMPSSVVVRVHTWSKTVNMSTE